MLKLKLLIVLTLFIFMNIQVKSQRKNFTGSKIKLDSVYREDNSFSKYEYDSNGKLLKEEHFNRNIDSNSWNGSFMKVYTYTNNLLIERINYAWDESLNKWLELNKGTFEYNEKNLISTGLSYQFNIEINDWVVKSKTQLDYDEKNRITYREYFDWNYVSLQWVENSKQIYKYDENNNLIFDEYYQWNKGSNSYVGTAIRDYFYNAKNLLLEEVNYSWDFYNNNWVFRNKNVDSYDSNGNYLLISSYNWNKNNNQWIGSQKVEFDYNKENVESKRVKYLWNFTRGEWREFQKNETTFNVKNLPVLSTYHKFDTLSYTWIELYKEENFYDTNYNLIESIRKELYDFSTIYDFKSAKKYEYDLQDKLVSEIFLNWEINNKVWLNDRKNNFEYLDKDTIITTSNNWNSDLKEWQLSHKVKNLNDINNNLLYKEGFYYDFVTQTWVEANKEIYEFDNENRKILESRYFWDENLKIWVGEYKNIFKFDNFQNQINNENYYWDDALAEWAGIMKYETNYDYNFNTDNLYQPVDYRPLKYNNELIYRWNKDIKSWYVDLTHSYFYSELINTSIENEEVINNSHIFPNPSSEKITLDLGSVAVADLVIYDILGNEIMSIPNYSNKSEIDVSNLSIGTYTIQIQTSTGSISQRLLVNR